MTFMGHVMKSEKQQESQEQEEPEAESSNGHWTALEGIPGARL